MLEQEERRSGFGQLTRESLIYASGAAVGKVIGFLMLPVLTRFLEPAEYGRLDLLSTLGSAAISALLLGLDVAVVRIASDREATAAERRTVFGTWALIAAVLTVPVSAAIVLLSAPISTALFGSPAWAIGVSQVGLITVFGTYQVMALTLLRIARRPRAYAAISAGSLLINALVAVVLLVTWRPDSIAVLVALTVSLAVGAAAGMTLVGWHAIGRPASGAAHALVRLGLPLAPAVIAVWAGEFLNRSILLGRSDAEELGYLSVALRFGSIVGLAVVGFQLAWQPRAYALGTTSAALDRIGLDGRRIIVAVASIVVLVAAISPEAINGLAGARYQGATAAVGWVLVSQLGAASFLVLSMPSSLTRHFWHLGVAGVIGVALSVAINLAAVATLGATGTALALASGQCLAAAGVWLLGHNAVRVPFRLPWTVAVIAGAAIYAVVVASLGASASLPARILGLGAFGVLVAIDGTAWEMVRTTRRGRDGVGRD